MPSFGESCFVGGSFMTKFIFVTGGVVSSLGKGIIAASLGGDRLALTGRLSGPRAPRNSRGIASFPGA